MGGDIANVSVLGGFAYSDTPKNGMAIIVTARVANDALAVRLFNQHMPTETRDHQARLCARDGGP